MLCVHLIALFGRNDCHMRSDVIFKQKLQNSSKDMHMLHQYILLTKNFVIVVDSNYCIINVSLYHDHGIFIVIILH